MIEKLGQSPINSALTTGRSRFISIFRNQPSTAYLGGNDRYPRAYTNVRGILINKEYLLTNPIDLTKGYYFQFNPQTINDVKSVLYETRGYSGLSYNDYVWGGGGERLISFQLFLDNTPQSKTIDFRPQAYNSTLANTIIKESNDTEKIRFEGQAFSNTRVHERGILPETELLQSFLHPAPFGTEATPKFAEGGVVNPTQFRPPPTVVLALGPLYLEGVIKSAPITYKLFDADLTPLRATVDIEFAVFEFENIVRRIDWKAR